MHRRHAALALMSWFAPFAIGTPAAAPRQLTLYAEDRGTRTALHLRIDGGRVDGTIEETGLQLAVAGRLDGQRLEARLQEPVTELTFMTLSGTLHDDRLEATITPVAGRSPPVRAVFTRPGANAQSPAAQAGSARANAAVAAPAGSLDPRLVGRWSHQSMINSPGGAGGFASFTTERTLEFAADGRVQQSVRSVGGGGNWSSRSDREIEFSGRWQVRSGELWVQAAVGGTFRRAGAYRFSGEYLVIEGQGGRRIWQR